MVSSPLSLSRPHVGECRRLQLSSPLLHIGAAVASLNPFEYITDGNKVYFPDSEALAKALHQRGRLQDYIGTIENRREIAPMLRQAFGETWSEATDPEGNPLFPAATIAAKWTDRQITDLRPAIRNGFGQLYIPGSSIKGAIRTAVAYHLLKHADRYRLSRNHRVSDIEQQLHQKLKQGEFKSRWRQSFADDSLFMNELFANFSLHRDDRTAKTRPGPNTDFMRALQVTDCEPLLPRKIATQTGKRISLNVPAIAEVLVSSYYPDFQAKYRASLYVEVIRNVRTAFSLSLDTEMLSWFRHQSGMQLPFKTLDELLAICQEFAQDQWDGEHDYWQEVRDNRDRDRALDFTDIRQFYEKERCPYALRLGWASGMTGTTIGWLFKDKLRAELRDACGNAAPGFAAPKSRRTVLDPHGTIKFVPGWVKFKSQD